MKKTTVVLRQLVCFLLVLSVSVSLLPMKILAKEHEMFPLGKMANYNQVKQGKKVKSDYQTLITNLTKGTIVLSSNAAENIEALQFSRLFQLRQYLQMIEISAVIRVPDLSLLLLDVKENKLLGLQEGDEIQAKQLITCYFFGGYDDAKYVLDHFISGVAHEKYEDDDEISTYDVYTAVYELLQITDFIEMLEKEVIPITFQSKEGKTKKFTCENELMKDLDSMDMPKNLIPLLCFTVSKKEEVSHQLLLFRNTAKKQCYLSVVAQVPVRVDIDREREQIFQPIWGKSAEQTVVPTVTPTPVLLDYPTDSNDARYQFLLGTNYKAYTIDQPPKGYQSAWSAAKNMKTISVPVWQINATGKKFATTMQLTIHHKLVSGCEKIFKEIFALKMKFPIRQLKGFGYRKVGGVGLSAVRLMSIHSFGAAIDINYADADNDYYLGKGNDLRDKSNPYCIPEEVIAIFNKYGWFWGGDFEICADTMHFQYLGLEFLSYQGKSPFRELSVNREVTYKGADVKNLQQRLKKLGFRVVVDGIYGKSTETVVRTAQKKYGLKVTGVVDEKTWETIINKTNDMSYVF